MGVNRQLYAVLVAVFCVVLCEVVRTALLDLVEVLVGIEAAFFTLDNKTARQGTVMCLDVVRGRSMTAPTSKVFTLAQRLETFLQLCYTQLAG